MKGPYVVTWVAEFGVPERSVERRVVLYTARETPIRFRSVAAAEAAFARQFRNMSVNVRDMQIIPYVQWVVEYGV